MDQSCNCLIQNIKGVVPHLLDKRILIMCIISDFDQNNFIQIILNASFSVKLLYTFLSVEKKQTNYYSQLRCYRDEKPFEIDCQEAKAIV